MEHNYRHVDLKVNDPKRCMQVCLSEPRCKAWTFVKPNTFQGPLPKCWLKDAVLLPTKDPNCISGVKTKFPVRPGKITLVVLGMTEQGTLTDSLFHRQT